MAGQATTSNHTKVPPTLLRRKSMSALEFPKFHNIAENSFTKKFPFRNKKKTTIAGDIQLLSPGGPSSSSSSSDQNENFKSWSESFENLLADKRGVELFRLFLQREFSDENIEFWLACEDFKRLKGTKMDQKAREIYSDFVAIQAPREVNLESATRDQTITSLKQPDKRTFDLAQARIVALMEKDSYPRFLKSDLYLNLAK